jgi:hypothetical protein
MSTTAGLEFFGDGLPTRSTASFMPRDDDHIVWLAGSSPIEGGAPFLTKSPES